MARVLIANTYFLDLDPKQKKLMQPYPPLGTLYVASVLKDSGFHVDLADTIFAASASAIFPSIENNKGNIFIICDDGFNYLTKMCLVNMREACFEMIRYAKQNNCTVIVSSSDATDHWQTYLEKGADYIVIGEPEQTILELTNFLNNNSATKLLSEISGIAYKQNEAFIKNAARAVLNDLDTLPFPAWQLADINGYRKKWWKKNKYFSLNITTTRGCPFKCNWCAKPIYGNRYNSRSPENVVDEIEFLIQNYQPTHFWFCDDIFGLKPGWIKKFSELIQERNLEFRFKIQCRADLLLNENNIAFLAEAGCDEIWIGAESGSQKILDAMDKGITVEQIYHATELMKKNKIKPCYFLQFGYPGELQEDINATLKMLLDLMPYDIGISVSYPLPGTKFFEMVKKDLQQKQNWNDSDELALMFHSTFPAAYYKQLHRYIHKRYRTAQAFEGIKNVLRIQSMDSVFAKRILALPFYYMMAVLHKQKLKTFQL